MLESTLQYKPFLEYAPGRSSYAKDASPESFGHTGFTGTCVWMDPDNQILYIFLSNRVYPDAGNNKLRQYNIRTRIQEVIYKALAAGK